MGEKDFSDRALVGDDTLSFVSRDVFRAVRGGVADPIARAELVADSLGCSWAYAQASFVQGRTMALDSLLDLGGARRFAFVRGHLLPASPPRCGQNVALHLEGALVEY